MARGLQERESGWKCPTDVLVVVVVTHQGEAEMATVEVEEIEGIDVVVAETNVAIVEAHRLVVVVLGRDHDHRHRNAPVATQDQEVEAEAAQGQRHLEVCLAVLQRDHHRHALRELHQVDRVLDQDRQSGVDRFDYFLVAANRLELDVKSSTLELELAEIIQVISFMISLICIFPLISSLFNQFGSLADSVSCHEMKFF